MYFGVLFMLICSLVVLLWVVDGVVLDSLCVLMVVGEVIDLDYFVWFFYVFGWLWLLVINYSGGMEVLGVLLGNVFVCLICVCVFNVVLLGVDVFVVDE